MWAAAGLLLLGFVVAWVLVIRVKTTNGMIELVDLPKDAEVLVDGEEVAITWPGGGKPAVVTVTAGKHKIMVKKDGLEISGDEVTVQADGKEKFTVRFVAPTRLPHELPKGDGADPTRTAGKDVRSDAGLAAKTALSQQSIKNSIGMTLTLIPAGEFFMGPSDGDKDSRAPEKLQHKVRISKPFYLGVCEVTQAQYEAVMGNNPSWFSTHGWGKDWVAGHSTDRHPVENVSWLDATRFCNKLSEKERKKPFYEIDGKEIRVPDWNGPGYRLPTEAEWEYACQANASTPMRFSFGNDAGELDDYAWFKRNSDSHTAPDGPEKAEWFRAIRHAWQRLGMVLGLARRGLLQSVADGRPDRPGEGFEPDIPRRELVRPPPRLPIGVRRGLAPGWRWGNLGFRLALGQSGR